MRECVQFFRDLRDILDIAPAKGMSQIAGDTDLSRESPYKALSGNRNPTLDPVIRVVGALGLKLRAEAVADSCATD